MKPLIFLLPAVLLAACGNEADTVITDPATGETATISHNGGDEIKPPANLPAFATIFPGGTVQTAITNSAEPGKGLLAFGAAATPDEIVAFYRDKGKAAGLEVEAEMQMNNGRMLTLRRPGANDSALAVTAMPGDDGGPTQVSLVYQVEAAAP